MRWQQTLVLLVCANLAYSGPAVSNSKADSRIETELDKSTQVQFRAIALRDACKVLSQMHAIKISLPSSALEKAGIDASAPVTFEVRGVTLRSTLSLILNPYGLDYRVENDAVVIVPLSKKPGSGELSQRQRKAAEVLKTRLERPVDFAFVESPLTDIARVWTDKGGMPVFLDASALKALNLSPETPVSYSARGLPLRQGMAAVLVLLNLKAEIRHEVLLITGRDATSAEVISDAMKKAAQTEVEVVAAEMLLTDVLTLMEEKVKCPVVLDRIKLKEVGVKLDQPITVKATKGALRDVLRQILEPLKLQAVARDDVIFVTARR